MKDFTTENMPGLVLEEYADKIQDPRLKEVMLSLIKHLHSFVKEVQLTEEEWFKGIQFLTAVGHKCDDVRQEFILLSDTLGVSTLVDAINHDRGGIGTENAVLGPFYLSGAPKLPMGANIAKKENPNAVMALVQGRVLDDKGQAIAGAVVDVWQASFQGAYHMQDDNIPEFNLCAQFTTGDDGKYWFVTEQPASYPVPDDGPVARMLEACGRHLYRPGHIHFIVSAPGYDRLTTQIFTKGDKYLDSDVVFATKERLVGEYVQTNDPARAQELGLKSPFLTVDFDFVLMPE